MPSAGEWDLAQVMREMSQVFATLREDNRAIREQCRQVTEKWTTFLQTQTRERPSGTTAARAQPLTQEAVLRLISQYKEGALEDGEDINTDPPYPLEILEQPYPEGYVSPQFVLYDGVRGNPKEHVKRFVESLGRYARNDELRLREFPKSLSGKA